MSDDDSFTLPRNKTLTFTLGERKLLLRLVNKHYEVVHNKKVDSKSTNQKNQAWELIHEEFVNSNTVHSPRTSQQLKRCWENLRCKAKKGDSVAQKLLRWAENQYQMNQRKKNGVLFSDTNEIEDISEPMLDQESDCSTDDKYESGNDLKDLKDSLEESIQQLTHLSEASSCQHCQCDKVEKIEKMRLLKLEKQQKERIYNMKVQNLRAKTKRAKELYKLAVHEMTLRVENERRRAEILEKELSRQI